MIAEPPNTYYNMAIVKNWMPFLVEPFLDIKSKRDVLPMKLLNTLFVAILIFLTLPSQTYAMIFEEEIFRYIPNDIEEDYWTYDEIMDFIYADIINGFEEEDGFYVYVRPDNKITRAEFVKTLVTALGLEVENRQNLISFSDVKEDNWYCDYVNTANSLGIVNGKNNNQFAPNDFITRAEMAAILVHAFDKTIVFQDGHNNTFKDVGNLHWAFEEINKASTVGIVQGKNANAFMPDENATRAEAIVMIYRALNLETVELPNEKDLVQMVENHVKQMNVNRSNHSFDEIRNSIDLDSTGEYNAGQDFTTKYFEVLIGFGEELISEFNLNNMKVRTLSVNTRKAVVEVYDVYIKYGFELLIDEMDGSVFYLKKDQESGGWKIYHEAPSYIE